ncbi:PREDICTED: calcium-binding mitochondrial carrier protein SCaMC-1-like [Priapulus caudatus]|uniref:Calcium-binding mitochondrial carrier protein SCaMC-1-like n=1 Tax=Priapulus caudatus TaxID=37621 RepID=A0ABM1DZ32_PRICU|nr:PREDICTED: calcium-binding mitochondrial carrier protein SCaMC-1-like [Priapulus caudatus]
MPGNIGSSPLHPHTGLHTMPPEEVERLSSLFEKLDVNKDGKIDVEDLSAGLHAMGIPTVAGQAEKMVKKADIAKDGGVDFAEFAQYVIEHEKTLMLHFRSMDANDDGKIDAQEIVSSLKTLGVHIDAAEAQRLLRRMDKDGSLSIDWNEWRNYLFLNPSTDIHGIINFWRHQYFVDVGEDLTVPEEFTESEIQQGVWWRHLVAGGSAGAVSRTCTAPLDRLKVLLQVNMQYNVAGSATIRATKGGMLQVHATKANQLGILSGMKHMLHEGGTQSLWRGNFINVLKIAPESAIKFMAYEQIKRLIRRNDHTDVTIGQRFCAGSAAGAISQSTIYPLEVLKTRLALRRTGQYSSISDAAKKIYRNEGLLCFYRGYVPNLLGIIPYAGIDLAVYESLKRWYLTNHSKVEDPGVLLLLTCGTASSTCGQLASYPLALVRTRLQALGVTGGKQDMTMLGMFRAILQSEGVTGLYRGIAPNFMKVAPAVGISYVVYEHVRRALGVEMT